MAALSTSASLYSLKNKVKSVPCSYSEVTMQSKSHDNEQLCKNSEHWKKNLRKKMKNLGKAYIMQNGKEVKGKIYKQVMQCCSFKCFQNFSSDNQKRIFSEFWNMGDWNKQTKFLWEYINIVKAVRKTTNSTSRRVHTRQFYLPNLQNKSKVCKKMFMSVLQISNGRINYTLNKKLVAGPNEEPKDKRGLNTPANKTSEAAIHIAKLYIRSLPHNQVYQEKKAKSSVLQGVTIKKTHAVYKQFCIETRKPIVSIKVFRKLLPRSRKEEFFNVSSPPELQENKIDNYSCIVQTDKKQSFQGSCKLSADPTSVGYKEAHSKGTTCLRMTKGHKISKVTEGQLSNTTYYQSTPQSANNNPSRQNHAGKLSIHNLRKQLRNEGKSYVASSGKIVWGKEFLPQYTCCNNKCHEFMPVEQQEILFRQYWALGTWNLQTKFLWDHIEIKGTIAKTSQKAVSRRVHTRIYFLPNFEGIKKKVCKILFCSVLQISNGRLSRAVNHKAINPTDVPEDKRDIGANLTDDMYQGVYHGSKKHEADLELVLKRAWDVGLSKVIITGTSLSDTKTALQLAKTNEQLYCTAGCHPTRCGEFEQDDTDPETYLENLLQLTLDNRDNVIAIGECGLDYDRTQFCAPDIQRKYFEKQINLAEVTGLPMFLHCRNSASDLVKILTAHREKLVGGVVHSFDGTKEEAQQILDLDLFIGINGCSLKTEDNLVVAASVPPERLMIETDSPWCEIRPTHAGYKHVKTTFPTKKKEKWQSGVMVKSRNEPNCIVFFIFFC
ncbi:uncharacterized protein [Cherax quadricarinatus]|uniref:uncharacterized protein isoform X2 n=1 Tax=Cherax quadricarinatus TaxID=27406 RepID=UPI00387E7CD0